MEHGVEPQHGPDEHVATKRFRLFLLGTAAACTGVVAIYLVSHSSVTMALYAVAVVLLITGVEKTIHR